MLTGAPEGAPRKAAIKRHSRHLLSIDRLLNPIAETQRPTQPSVQNSCTQGPGIF